MAWIESHEEMGEHRKTHSLCNSLNVTVPTAVGHLHLLWHYTVRTAWETGSLAGKLPEAISNACWWRGDPQIFIDALISSGFVDSDMKVHEWELYAKELIYQRQYNRRKRAVATAVKHLSLQVKNDHSAPVTIPYHTIPEEKNVANEKQEEKEELCENTNTCLNTESLKNNDNQAQREIAFEKIWAKYPDRKGKKAARRHFMNSVKDLCDLNNINKALTNYLNSERVSKGFVQNGSTWFNNWADWVECDEPMRV
jgi:hypothetical protein